MRRVCLLLAAVAAPLAVQRLLCAQAEDGPPGPDPTFTIVFTKNVNGETEPCG